MVQPIADRLYVPRSAKCARLIAFHTRAPVFCLIPVARDTAARKIALTTDDARHLKRASAIQVTMAMTAGTPKKSI